MDLEKKNRIMDKAPAHDTKAHEGKGLSQTGLIQECRRCRIVIFLTKKETK